MPESAADEEAAAADSVRVADDEAAAVMEAEEETANEDEPVAAGATPAEDRAEETADATTVLHIAGYSPADQASGRPPCQTLAY